jgi:hypothetical protein
MKRSRPSKKSRSSKRKSSTFFEKYKLPIVAAAFIIVIAILFSQTEVMDRLTVARFYEGPVNCGSYITQNTKLTDDVLGCTQDKIIMIQGDDITFDCDGHTLQGEGIWHGVVVHPNSVGVTVKNCNVILEGESARPEASGRIVGTSYGIEANDEATIEDSNVYVSGDKAIIIDESNVLLRNTIESGSEDALAITGDNNIIIDNEISGPLNVVNMFATSGTVSNNYFKSNTITAGNTAIFLQFNANNNLFTLNFINSETTSAIRIGSCAGNVFYNNVISTRIINPVYLHDSSALNYWNAEIEAGKAIVGEGNQVGGNYWTTSEGDGYSDTCADTDTDGFCDEPYKIWQYSEYYDSYPLSDEFLPSWIMFVPEYTTEGNIAYDGEVGLAAADKVCQTEADLDDSTLPNGIYVALMSTSDLNAVDRLVEGKFYNNNPDVTELIAENIADLFDGSINNNIHYGAWGQEIATDLIAWTGTNVDGSKKLDHTCSDWTDKFTSIGYYGSIENIDSTWIYSDVGSCDEGYRFYCVGVEEQFVVEECVNDCDPADPSVCAGSELVECRIAGDGCYDIVTDTCNLGCADNECILCLDECDTVDYPMCNPDSTATDAVLDCEQALDGCYYETTTGDCEFGCENAECNICEDECDSTDPIYPYCNAGSLEICLFNQADGCYDKSPVVCDNGCEAKACVQNDCTNECDIADYPQCNDDDTASTTCELQGDGCYDSVAVDCAAGCDPVGGVCLVEQSSCVVHEDCPDDYMCVNELCYSTQCSVSEDCATGYICTDGDCIPDPTIVIAATCGDGSCDDGESCSSCEVDCGRCSGGGGGSSSSSSGGTSFTNEPVNDTCQPDVTCTKWIDCDEGFQTRTCTDNNECLEDSPYTSKRECKSDAGEAEEPKVDDSGKFGSFDLPEDTDNRWFWFGGLLIVFIAFLLYYFKFYKPNHSA